MPRWNVTVAAALLLTCSVFSHADPAESWPGWRGGDGSGMTANTLPSALAGLEQAWHVELGKGYPGPIVTTDRVFVVETVENDDVRVRALSRDSGRELWRQGWESDGDVPFFAARNGDWVRSTPAWDGRRLFVGDMQEVLVALDGSTGEVLWRVDFPKRYGTPVPPFGFASSPLLDGEFLFVQAADSIIKLNAASGEVVWRKLATDTNIMSGGAFSSPALAELGGKRQLLVQSRLTLHGLDPESGVMLWKHDVPSFRGMNILTPLVHGDGVFTSSYKNGSFFYQVNGAADGQEARQAWSNKAAAYMSSPLIIGDHAYVHLGNGRLDCIHLSTGESAWRSESGMGDYWSMVHGKDRQGRATILALSEAGELFLIDPDPEALRIRERREVADQETWGHVAVADGQVFVRELRGISAWRASAPAAAAESRGTGD